MTRLHSTFSVLVVVIAYASSVQAAEPASSSEPAALQIVGGPYLQTPTPTSMTIVWTTNAKCASRVEYGPSPDDLSKVAVRVRHGLVDANCTLHRITLSGLEPGTTYHYRLVSNEITEFRPYRVKFGQSVKYEGQFTTLDPEKEAFSFVIINDRHDKVPALRQALSSTNWEDVDLVFAVGDMMNDPMTERQMFEKFINPCAEFFAARIPMVLVRGNHETRGAMARHVMDYFPTESGRYYYSFTHGGVYFLLLDGGEDKDDAMPVYAGLVAFDDYVKEQTDWLEQELRSSAFREARFRLCLLHIPPVVNLRHDPAEFMRAPWIRDNWTPMLGQAGIDLMISGHTHRYAEMPAEEGRAFPLLIGGTNTVIRVDVSPQLMQFTTYNDDGTVLSRPPDVRRK